MNNSPGIFTLNAGSSSVKFAFYDGDAKRVMGGVVERVATPGEAVHAILEKLGDLPIGAVGHRIVHGGPNLLEHRIIDDAVVQELERVQPLDLAHLPEQIALIRALRSNLPDVPQIACFDTAFFRDLPTVSRRLPVPRRFDHLGVRRYGFHGLSYTYLMGELARIDSAAAHGRVILAHLGAGASLAALRDGKPIDTTMAFTPTAGLLMGTRPGDLDPGLIVHLMAAGKLSPAQMDELINKECGLLGISETTFDMRDLIAAREKDMRAREAVDIFCYQLSKFIGAYVAALGGLDTLVFSGGIGEHSHEVREQTCKNLGFMGVRLGTERNRASAPIISDLGAGVTVRVITTDEEVTIARIVMDILKIKTN